MMRLGSPRYYELSQGGFGFSEDDVNRRRRKSLAKHRCQRVEDNAFHLITMLTRFYPAGDVCGATFMSV